MALRPPAHDPRQVLVARLADGGFLPAEVGICEICGICLTLLFEEGPIVRKQADRHQGLRIRGDAAQGRGAIDGEALKNTISGKTRWKR